MRRTTDTASRRPLRPTGAALAIALLTLSTAIPAASSTLTVAIGKEATLLHVPTGETRLDGRRIGEVEVSRRRVEARCLRLDPDFEGYVRLRPTRRSSGSGSVKVECLGEVAPSGG